METSAPPDVGGAAALRRLSRVLPFLFALALLPTDRPTSRSRATCWRTRASATRHGLGARRFRGLRPCSCRALRRAALGAPRWLAFILCWGVTSMSFAALRGAGAAEFTFYALRLLLGCFEAGCFPTIWYYLSLAYAADELTEAYPRDDRHRRPGALGGLVAAAILSLDGAGGVRGGSGSFCSRAASPPSLRLRRRCCCRATPRTPWLGPRAPARAPPRGAHRGQDVAARDRRRAGGDAAPDARRRSQLAHVVGGGDVGAPVRRQRHLVFCRCSSARSCPTRRRPPSRSSPPSVHRRHRRSSPTRATARASERRWHCAARSSCAVALALTPLAARASAPLALLAATSGAGGLRPFLFLARHVGDADEAAAAVATINSVSQAGGLVGPALVGVLSDAEGGVEAAGTCTCSRSPPPPAPPRSQLTFAPKRPAAVRGGRAGALPPVTEAL